MNKVRIGIDVMGGDFAPSATIEGSVLALDNLANGIEIVLIGDQDQITSELKNTKSMPLHLVSFMPPTS